MICVYPWVSCSIFFWGKKNYCLDSSDTMIAAANFFDPFECSKSCAKWFTYTVSYNPLNSSERVPTSLHRREAALLRTWTINREKRALGPQLLTNKPSYSSHYILYVCHERGWALWKLKWCHLQKIVISWDLEPHHVLLSIPNYGNIPNMWMNMGMSDCDIENG